jgi:hypothetical protein
MTNDQWYYETLAELKGKSSLSESGIEIIIIQTIAKYMHGSLDQIKLVEIIQSLSTVNEALSQKKHYLIQDLILIKEDTESDIVDHLLTDALQKIIRT